MERTMFGRTIFGAVSLAALLAATLAFAEPAHAQLVATDPSNNSVLVDLGAIDGGQAPSYGVIGGDSRFSGTAAPGIGAGGNTGPLLMPPQAAPSSRLMGPDGRALRSTPRASQPRTSSHAPSKVTTKASAKAAPTRTAAIQPQAQSKAKADPKTQAKAEPAKPALPPVSLPSMPAPQAKGEAKSTAAQTPAQGQTQPKGNGGPTPLETPTPPPAVAAAPAPDIPPMQLVGPAAAPKAEQQQAAVSSQMNSQATVAPAPQAKPEAKSATKTASPAPQPSKGPTPAPQIASAPPPDSLSASPSASPSSSTAPAAKSAPKAEQQAALPPPTKGAGKGATPRSTEILFTIGDANLSDAAKTALDKIADSLKGDEKSRLQLLAYANEDQASPSKSRRLSLSRALAVRSHLISKGIRSTRIDVRALGDQNPGGEPNRVDLQIIDR
jgi:outer membrane protein OmpA-like peptidoglycan-associated protein